MATSSMMRRRRQLRGGKRNYAGAHARTTGDPRKFAASGLVALWNTALGITLNGNDASAIASQVGGAIDLSQGTAANQPLYTGAPAYNGTPSIAFTAANNDRLQLSNTDLVGTGPCTFISTQRLRNNPASFAYVLVNASAGSGVGLNYTGAPLRGFAAAFVADRATAGAPSTTAPECWVGFDSGSTPNAAMMVNCNAVTVTNSTTAHTAPGGTALVAIGGGTLLNTPDMDWLGGCIFTQRLGNSEAYRISKAQCAQVGAAPAA